MSSKIQLLWLIAGLTLSEASLSWNSFSRRACHPDDLKGLNDFKQAIVRDTSGRLDKWHGHDCCKWVGIFCDNITFRVTALVLVGMVFMGAPVKVNMTGLLSPSITLLTYLEVIDLSYELFLEGSIPPSIGLDLPRLSTLTLRGNRLTGRIPRSIGQLSNLYSFTAENNMIQGPLPPELSSLKNLQYLSLSGNRLTGRIPEEFLKLTNLTELELSGNDLEGEIPSGPPLINFPKQSYSGNRGLCGKPLDPCSCGH